MEILPNSGGRSCHDVFIRRQGTPKKSYYNRIRELLFGVLGDGEQYAILHMTGAAISKGLEIIEDLKRDIPNLEIESIERSEVDVVKTEIDESTFDEVKTKHGINKLTIKLVRPNDS